MPTPEMEKKDMWLPELSPLVRNQSGKLNKSQLELMIFQPKIKSKRANSKSELNGDKSSDETDCDDSHCDDDLNNFPRRTTLASTFKVRSECSRQLFGRVKQTGKTYVFDDH